LPRIANGSTQWPQGGPDFDNKSGYIFQAWNAIARVKSGIGLLSAEPRQSYSTLPAVDRPCIPGDFFQESGETAKYND
jgi:hypothetical protein